MREQQIHQVNFAYEYPLIYLDFLDMITGEKMLARLQKFEFPGTYH
jgi:hypothetical protein